MLALQWCSTKMVMPQGATTSSSTTPPTPAPQATASLASGQMTSSSTWVLFYPLLVLCCQVLSLNAAKLIRSFTISSQLHNGAEVFLYVIFFYSVLQPFLCSLSTKAHQTNRDIRWSCKFYCFCVSKVPSCQLGKWGNNALQFETNGLSFANAFQFS